MTHFLPTAISTPIVYKNDGALWRAITLFVYYRYIYFPIKIYYRVLTRHDSHATLFNTQARAMITNIIKKLFGGKKKETKERDFEWERFQKTAKDQFIKLKEKGLSIPVVTL